MSKVLKYNYLIYYNIFNNFIIIKINYQISSSILPYSLNADVIRLPIAYRYPNEKLRKNENARKQAAKIEC